MARRRSTSSDKRLNLHSHPILQLQWSMMDRYSKGDPYKARTWQMFQDSLNSTLKDNFIPTPKQLALQICLDDDKGLCAYSSLRNVPVDDESIRASSIERPHLHGKDSMGLPWLRTISLLVGTKKKELAKEIERSKERG